MRHFRQDSTHVFPQKLLAAGFAAGFHDAHRRNLSSRLSRVKYWHSWKATLTLRTSAVILEHAGGEGRFRWSGITETFGISIKRKTDVVPAASWKVEKPQKASEWNATILSFRGIHPLIISSHFPHDHNLRLLHVNKKSKFCFLTVFLPLLTLWTVFSPYLPLILLFC